VARANPFRRHQHEEGTAADDGEGRAANEHRGMTDVIPEPKPLAAGSLFA